LRPKAAVHISPLFAATYANKLQNLECFWKEFQLRAIEPGSGFWKIDLGDLNEEGD
jgi:hypothetical protein